VKTGLKSILFGYHALWLHPFFVAEAWRRIYGFPFDLRLWVAFFVHDLGYYDCEHMDDAKGERHPEFGAKVMHFLFDWPCFLLDAEGAYTCMAVETHVWERFCLYHSRIYAAGHGQPISKLAYADKFSLLLYPRRLLKLLYWFSGEWEEYRRNDYLVPMEQWHKDRGAPLSWEEWYHQAVVATLKTLKEINYVHRM
jgi:hypothetical protein